MLRFDKATYLPFLFKFILSGRFSNNLWGLDVLLFLEYINKVFIVFFNFIKFIILLYTFLVTSLSRYKEYMIWCTSFSKFSDVLVVFIYANAIGKLWSICLGVNILIPLPFCCLLKSRILSTIWNILLRFSFQEFLF